jgi:Ca2+-transporting ATPase
VITLHFYRDGRVQEEHVEDLVVGDVVLLNIGNRVPADLRLFEAIDLRIDESVLTGESKPAKKVSVRYNRPYIMHSIAYEAN